MDIEKFKIKKAELECPGIKWSCPGKEHRDCCKAEEPKQMNEFDFRLEIFQQNAELMQRVQTLEKKLAHLEESVMIKSVAGHDNDSTLDKIKSICLWLDLIERNGEFLHPHMPLGDSLLKLMMRIDKWKKVIGAM